MRKFCIMSRNDNFSLQKNFKNLFCLLHDLLLPVREHFLKFYRSAGIERFGITVPNKLAETLQYKFECTCTVYVYIYKKIGIGSGPQIGHPWHRVLWVILNKLYLTLLSVFVLISG